MYYKVITIFFEKNNSVGILYELNAAYNTALNNSMLLQYKNSIPPPIDSPTQPNPIKEENTGSRDLRYQCFLQNLKHFKKTKQKQKKHNLASNLEIWLQTRVIHFPGANLARYTHYKQAYSSVHPVQKYVGGDCVCTQCHSC